MPDWSSVVCGHLNLAEFSPQEQKEIIAELASHLDDLCRQYLLQGLTGSEAVNRTLAEIAERHLLKDIKRSKLDEGTVNHRTRQLWLPTLQTMAIAILLPPVLVRILFAFHIPPHTLHFDSLLLVFALLAGAVGARASRQAGGDCLFRMAPALFSALAYPFVIGCVFFARTLAPANFSSGGTFLGPTLAHVVILPGLAMLLGAVPFLRRQREVGESGVNHG